MIKKILLGVLVLIVLVIVAGGFLTYKVVDEAIKEKEPMLRQYVQMDKDAQDKYVLEHAADLLSKIDIDNDGKPEEKEQFEAFQKANTNPEIQSALVDLGRSTIAGMIKMSDSILKDMNDATKAQYDKEAGEFGTRLKKYTELLKAAGVKME